MAAIADLRTNLDAALTGTAMAEDNRVLQRLTPDTNYYQMQTRYVGQDPRSNTSYDVVEARVVYWRRGDLKDLNGTLAAQALRIAPLLAISFWHDLASVNHVIEESPPEAGDIEIIFNVATQGVVCLVALVP